MILKALLAAGAAGIAALGGLIAFTLNYPRRPVRPAPGRFDGRNPDALADELLAQMSTEEKLAQLSGDLGRFRLQLRYGANMLARRGPPLVYSGRNDRLGIPPFGFADGPRGMGVGTGGTAFPVTMARGASFDRDLERRVGEAMGCEVRAAGASYSGAVCVNLLRHPGWGRAQETYGEDPYHLGQMGVALTRGIQAHNVMACVKHFALNSIENARFYVDVRVDERTLREVYLPHFKAIVQEGGVASVMSAYNKLRGEHCGHSRALLTGILREEWGFAGFVTSDWIHGVRDGVAGLNAGMDVEMPSPHRYGAPLAAAVEDGRVSMETVDASVRRVLATRLRYALAPDPRDYPPSLIGCAEHAALAREVAEASAVLVKNDGALPFGPEVKTVAVIGRMAALENTGDHGSSNVFAPYVVSPLAGIQAFVASRGGSVRYSDGADPEAAAAVARGADAVVIVAGLTWREEGEYFVMNPDAREAGVQPPFFRGGGDRTDLGLRAADVALIRRVAPENPAAAVVVVSGSAVTLEWREVAPAVLFTFYSGMEGGHALARLLFGAVSPSGKLPFTVPEDPADLPTFAPFADTADYGYYHGYTLFERRGLPAAYPFGHGLSYAAFSYSALTVLTPEVDPGGALEVAVTVANTGAAAGAEVVQLYVGFEGSAVERPIKLLRGFEKVHLAPGESREVRFAVPAASLAWYDPASRSWRVEAMEHQVYAGGTSDPAGLLEGSFAVRG